MTNDERKSSVEGETPDPEGFRIDLDNGKYTVVWEGPTKSFHALRHGEPWILNLWELPGSRMIFYMASDLDQAKKRIKELERTHGPVSDMDNNFPPDERGKK